MSPPLPFKPFDEHGAVRTYNNGFLPHWRQDGCTYFVTFRLADSIPAPVVRQWKHERDCWLVAKGIDPHAADAHNMLGKLPAEDRRQLERFLAGKMHDYLDRGHGDCLLDLAGASKLVADALLHFHGQRLDAGDFVVMPNHVHALVTPYPGFELEKLLHSIKSFTANRINRLLNRSGSVWMEETHDHIVRDGEDLLRIQEYIRRNPHKAGIRVLEHCLRRVQYVVSETFREGE